MELVQEQLLKREYVKVIVIHDEDRGLHHVQEFLRGAGFDEDLVVIDGLQLVDVGVHLLVVAKFQV